MTTDDSGDELDNLIDRYVDAMIESVRTWYVVHPTKNVVSPYQGKFQLKKAILANYIPKECIKARLIELDLLEQAINGGHDITKYKLMRLEQLLADLRAAGGTQDE